MWVMRHSPIYATLIELMVPFRRKPGRVKDHACTKGLQVESETGDADSASKLLLGHTESRSIRTS